MSIRSRDSFAAARGVIARAIDERAFPAAVAEVGDATRPVWTEAFGQLTFEAAAPSATSDTIFDLASLTKVLATTPLVMQLVERGTLGLDDPVSRHLPAWAGRERDGVTLRDLLAHCSGLPAYRPLYLRERGDAAFQSVICALPLEYAPRSQSRYSDLDMMLLGFILGGSSGLPSRLAGLLQQMRVADPLQFDPPARWRTFIAPTAQDPYRGRLLVGEPDDANAWALDGAAGHAGMFGTAPAVGAFARHLLQVLDGRTGAFQRGTLETFIARRDDVPGSTRALGWDTMKETSSCGSRMSPRAFGHPGYTGTSLWIDPERGVYAVLLTNRVHPARTNVTIREVRRAFHDAVFDALD